MSRQSASADDRRLMDRLVPVGEYGRLLGVVATTYEMQPEFFETDFLPTLLGLGAWDDRNWSSRIALEKHLAELEAATIFLDAHPYRGRPRSLRVEVQPVALKQGRLLHAKVLLCVHEKTVRLIVGSANLTEPGYRRNREVVSVISAGPDRTLETQIVADAVNGFGDQFASSMTPAARNVIDLAREKIRPWIRQQDARQAWFLWSGNDQPLWKQVLDRWPRTDSVQQISIVSPFWSNETSTGPITKLVSELRTIGCLGTNAELTLLTEAAPDKQGTYRPQLPETLHGFDARQLGIRACAIAVDPRVPAEEVGMDGDFTGTRPLHAKVLLLEGENTSLAYLGSANFTNSGWGFIPGRANIEAGVLLNRNDESRSALQSLLPDTTGQSVPLHGSATEKLATPEPMPDDLPWPDFLHSVLLTPAVENEDTLELLISINKETAPCDWRIAHLAHDDSPAEMLAVISVTDTSKQTVRVSLSQESLTRILKEQEVSISWPACPDGRSYPVNVSEIARPGLPISPGSGRPAEQHLIAYYQGRITWEDLFPDPSVKPGDTLVIDVPDEEGVDTSQIQSYIVREFVEALTGIRGDLKAAAQSSKACMRLALMGAVSPVALSRRIVEAANAGERTPMATGFQLVEILTCLDAARSYDVSPMFREDWLSLIDEATSRVAQLVEELQQRNPGDLSRDFKRYAKAVRTHHQAGQR